MSVGEHVKRSHTVKGRQHDQAFDEVLEFVLAAGGLSQIHPVHLAWHLLTSSVNVLRGGVT